MTDPEPEEDEAFYRSVYADDSGRGPRHPRLPDPDPPRTGRSGSAHGFEADPLVRDRYDAYYPDPDGDAA